MKLIITVVYTLLVVLVMGEEAETSTISKYMMAGFGWAIYMVGKLWWFRNDYDTNNDGLGLIEVGVYVKKNWITALFSGMLLVAAVPNAEWLWAVGTDLAGKDWPFGNFVYYLAGSLILFLQMLIDFFKSKKK